MSPRYAIYYLPQPDDPLFLKSSAWLGWNSHLGAICERPHIEKIAGTELRQLTSKPAVYGFHATLKPPFFLADGLREEDLVEDLEAFARAEYVTRLNSLEISDLGSFLALTEMTKSSSVSELAAKCVRNFDLFRREMTPEEFSRRKTANLTRAQMLLLETWGYPYVFEEYKFHMTLSGPLNRDQSRVVARVLNEYLSNEFKTTRVIDHITLLRQENLESNFNVVHSTQLMGSKPSR